MIIHGMDGAHGHGLWWCGLSGTLLELPAASRGAGTLSHFLGLGITRTWRTDHSIKLIFTKLNQISTVRRVNLASATWLQLLGVEMRQISLGPVQPAPQQSFRSKSLIAVICE